MKRNIKKYLILVYVIIFLLIVGIFYVGYNNNKAEHYYLLGKAYESQGYYDEAIKSYKNSINIRQDSKVYNALGNLKEYMGNNIVAVGYFQEGAALDANDTENNFDMARSYINLQDFDNAEKVILGMINRGYTTASVYALLGTVYIEEGRWANAESAFTKSLDLGESASVYNDMGYVYEMMGKNDLAIENYKKALLFDPNYEMAINNLERFNA